MITVAFLHHSMRIGGGAEGVIRDVLLNIDRERFTPLLYCMYELGDLGEEVEEKGIATYSHLFTKPLRPWDIGGFFRLVRRLREDNVSVLYSSDGFVNMIAAAIGGSLARTRVTVLGFHSYDTAIRRRTSRGRLALLAASDRVFHPLFDRYVALADSHKQYLIKEKRLPSRKIDLARNGVRVSEFGQGAEYRDVRGQLGVPPYAPMVVKVASLRRWKRHDSFLEAAEMILRSVPDAHFVLVGDGPERTRLEQHAQRLGVSEHTHFMGTVDYVPSVLREATVAVLASEAEALPLSLLEAMASGLPVVSTDVGSVRDIVVDDVTGILVPPQSSTALAQAIQVVLANPTRARAMGDAGYSRALELFDLGTTVADFERLIIGWVGHTVP